MPRRSGGARRPHADGQRGGASADHDPVGDSAPKRTSRACCAFSSAWRASKSGAFLRSELLETSMEESKRSPMFELGFENRRRYSEPEHVGPGLPPTSSICPMQELVTEYCWGAIWGRDDLSRKIRSLINIAMLTALNRQHELKAHVRGALVNGATVEEIRGVLLQSAVYCGVPAALEAFRTAVATRSRATRRKRMADIPAAAAASLPGHGHPSHNTRSSRSATQHFRASAGTTSWGCRRIRTTVPCRWITSSGSSRAPDAGSSWTRVSINARPMREAVRCCAAQSQHCPPWTLRRSR